MSLLPIAPAETDPSQRNIWFDKDAQAAYEEQVRLTIEQIEACPNRAALCRSAEIERNILDSYHRGEPHSLYLVVEDEVHKGIYDILIAGKIVFGEEETIEEALEKDQLQLEIGKERIRFNRTINYDAYDNPHTLVYTSVPGFSTS